MKLNLNKSKLVLHFLFLWVLVITNTYFAWSYIVIPLYRTFKIKDFGKIDRYSGARTNDSKSYDVLLMSYMRSGSTVLGRMLGWRNDSFYWFEPFWDKTAWGYFQEDGNMCFIDGSKCRQSSIVPEDILDILRRIYSCKFDLDFLRKIEHGEETRKYGGTQWASYRNCSLFRGFQSENCSELLSRVCQKAQRRVTKVLRLTTSFASQMLETFPKLKLVHLIRDPRAVINSGKYTDWFPLEETSDLEEFKLFSLGLCRKMIKDTKSSIALMSKYPDRVKIVQYEDLIMSGSEALNCLFKFLNMDYAGSNFELHKGSVYNWRTANGGLTETQLYAVDESCADTYQYLGYNTIVSGSFVLRSWDQSVTIPFKYQCF